VSLGLAKLGNQKSLDEVPGHGWPHSPTAYANNVHVIVLDALPGREVIVNDRGANARYLVRTDGSANATTADRHAALDSPATTARASGMTKSG
jgi:hypothetical protein